MGVRHFPDGIGDRSRIPNLIFGISPAIPILRIGRAGASPSTPAGPALHPRGRCPCDPLRSRAPFALAAHGFAGLLRAACPWRRLGYICGGRFRKCRKWNLESDSTYVKKGSEKTRTRTLFPEPEPFSYSSLSSGGPLNGPPRQFVLAAS